MAGGAGPVLLRRLRLADSPTLRALDAAALLVCLGLAAGAAAKQRRLALAGLTDYARDIVLSGVEAALGGLRLVFADIRWREIPLGGGTAKNSAAVGLGLAVALPPLLLFGSLFASADPIFRRLLQEAFSVDFGDLFGHLQLTTLNALAVGGFLRGLFWGKTAVREDRRPAFLTLGAVEIGVVLGLLDLLFLAFVLVQLRFFFGGAHLVQVTAGLTYAQYARGGFFELVAVAALVLPLLLAFHWLFRADGPGGTRLFRALAGLQVGLLFVIMASALQRMRLYQSEYGQTELRLYVTAFMAWLALVFAWFILTVLRDRRERFAFGALLAAFGMIATLHILNPDAAIVRANAAYARAGHPFDVDYALLLSADAVPGAARHTVRLVPTTVAVRDGAAGNHLGRAPAGRLALLELEPGRGRAANRRGARQGDAHGHGELNSMRKTIKAGTLAGRLAWWTLYAAAFGYVEALVVVYLRRLTGMPPGWDYPRIWAARGLPFTSATIFAEMARQGVLRTELTVRPPRYCCCWGRPGPRAGRGASGWGCSCTRSPSGT